MSAELTNVTLAANEMAREIEQLKAELATVRAKTLTEAADEAKQVKDRSWSYGAISEGHGARRVEDRLRMLARKAEAGER